MTNEWKTYYRALEQRLECPTARREEFLAETRRAAGNFTEENPGAEFSDVERFLGEPEELARTYNETLGAEVREKFRKGRRRRRVIALGIMFFALAAAVLYGIYLQKRQYDVDITREETIIIYETDEEGG